VWPRRTVESRLEAGIREVVQACVSVWPRGWAIWPPPESPPSAVTIPPPLPESTIHGRGLIAAPVPFAGY
jgi:hypothetical protein